MTHQRRTQVSRRRPTPPVASFPTVDQIASRAHELFVSGGRRLKDVARHWRTAEQELLEESARRIVGPRPSPK